MLMIPALLSIFHTIFTAFDCNPPLDVRSVYLDVSKACHRVWHEDLIYKLHLCGVSGNLLSLIKDFLANRKQRTVLNGKVSAWGSVTAGVPQGSILGPLFFLAYINDLTDNRKCNVKLFADDTSLFTVHNPDQAASDMNHDLDIIKSWAHNWRMLFNPDPTRQAVEVTFSRKKISANHPPVLFNDIPVIKMNEHKHLGIILDSKLSFATHIQSIILKCRRGIGMIKLLSKYLPRNTLTELYKLHVRPHLDYSNVIYHIPPKKCDFSQDTSLNNHMEKLKSVQYSAALAVTGAWKGTSRGKLYEELGWKSRSLRHWSRRLVLFCKIVNDITPDYTRYPIPQLPQAMYSSRNPDVVGQIRARTTRFKTSFYPDCLSEWSKLDPEIRLSPSLSLAILTQLRVGLSKLKFHKFRHNFRDTVNPLCPVNDGVEDTEHFLLLCHSYPGGGGYITC